MRITLLGTGTPTPSLKRMSAGYMVRTGDDVILFVHRSEVVTAHLLFPGADTG